MAQIATPSPAQLAQVAALRLAQSATRADGDGAFEVYFVAWAAAHRSTHLCRVAVEDDVVVGYGFLVLTERTPSPEKAIRWGADVQTVFVAPAHRGAGVGSMLVAGLVEVARERGAEHVTVHGNEDAASLYGRAGFAVDPNLMFQQVY